MKIDFENEIPRYMQVVHLLKRMMEDKRFKVGEVIPSENELTDQFKVSRTTIRKALEKLQDEGLIEKRQGKGSVYMGNKRKVLGSTLIGVIMPSITEDIYPMITRGVEEVSHEFNYSILYGCTNGSKEKEIKLMQQFKDKNIEGLIFEPTLSATLTERSPGIKFFNELNIPKIIVNHQLDGIEHNYVTMDDELGGEIGIKHLIDMGHKKIACIYRDDVCSGNARYRGYLTGMKKASLPIVKEYQMPISEFCINDAYQCTKKLMELEDPPTGIFYFNDEFAIEGYRYLKENSISVPEQLSIMGFDDTERGAFFEVPISTISHAKSLIGRWAADLLFESISRREIESNYNISISPKLIIRDSTAEI